MWGGERLTFAGDTLTALTMYLFRRLVYIVPSSPSASIEFGMGPSVVLIFEVIERGVSQGSGNHSVEWLVW